MDLHEWWQQEAIQIFKILFIKFKWQFRTISSWHWTQAQEIQMASIQLFEHDHLHDPPTHFRHPTDFECTTHVHPYGLIFILLNKVIFIQNVQFTGLSHYWGNSYLDNVRGGEPESERVPCLLNQAGTFNMWQESGLWKLVMPLLRYESLRPSSDDIIFSFSSCF